MIVFTVTVLLVMNFLIYSYAGFSGVICCTLGFAVAWLAVFILAMFGGEQIDWRKILDEKG